MTLDLSPTLDLRGQDAAFLPKYKITPLSLLPLGPHLSPPSLVAYTPSLREGCGPPPRAPQKVPGGLQGTEAGRQQEELYGCSDKDTVEGQASGAHHPPCSLLKRSPSLLLVTQNLARIHLLWEALHFDPFEPRAHC